MPRRVHNKKNPWGKLVELKKKHGINNSQYRESRMIKKLISEAARQPNPSCRGSRMINEYVNEVICKLILIS